MLFDSCEGQGRQTAAWRSSTSATPTATRPDMRLSEAVALFLDELRADGKADDTIKEHTYLFWSLLEFVACDPPLRELRGDLPQEYFRWLRATPQAPRRPRSLPPRVNPAAAQLFLRQPPPKLRTSKPRSEQTIGKYWRQAKPIFEFLGLPAKLPRRERPNLDLPPPLVPSKREIVDWWTRCLAPADGPWTAVSEPRRRRVVLTQGLVLLTGCRIEELLLAGLDDVEGHWLLLRHAKRRRPRIVYLSAAALGIAERLRHGGPQKRLFAEPGERFAGWRHSLSSWHSLVRKCGLNAEKPHQALRRVMSTWLHARDETAERAQLGHGGGVVFRHYLDVLRRLPAILERFALPSLPEIAGHQWPAKIHADRGTPRRLYEEFRRLVSRRRGSE